jgi:hypothetical protein
VESQLLRPTYIVLNFLGHFEHSLQFPVESPLWLLPAMHFWQVNSFTEEGEVGAPVDLPCERIYFTWHKLGKIS